MDGYPIKITRTIWGGVRTKSISMAVPRGDRSDNELVAEALKGRVLSFKELVERHQKKAYLFARGMVHNSDDAYDLSQEAFVRVYKHLKNFDPTYPFRVWLFHILANLCKNHLRQKKTREGVVVSSEDAADLAVSNDCGPDDALGQTENPGAGLERDRRASREIPRDNYTQSFPGYAV